MKKILQENFKALVILVVSLGLTALFVFLYVVKKQVDEEKKLCNLYIVVSPKWCDYSLNFSLQHQDELINLNDLFIEPSKQAPYLHVNERCQLVMHSTLTVKLIPHDVKPTITQNTWSLSQFKIDHDRIEVNFPKDFNAPLDPGPLNRSCTKNRVDPNT